MRTIGYDLGNDGCRMTVCDRRMDDLHCTNDKEWTQDHLCRYSTTYLQGHLSKIKHLLGRKFSDPELQSELDFLPFRVIEGPDGYPLVHCKCTGEDRAFSPTDILAMLISHLESLTSEEHLIYSDYPRCIGVPIYFKDEQKNDILEAAKVAGLVALSLLDETVAIALGYENSCLFNSTGITGVMAFVDIGDASMQVCFAEFETTCGASSVYDKKACTKISYQAYVRSLGGRDFNKLLFMHFASMIRKDYGIDVYKSANACVRLSDACEGLIKELSMCDTASFCIRGFSGSKDVNGSITRREFESMSAPIFKRIKEALEKALVDSGFDRCMVVGNGCSMPAIINILTEVFGVEPIKVTNSEEFIVRGCAISHVPWIARRRTSLAIDVRTSELVSIELPSEVKEDEDTERFLWRRAMENTGPSLTFLNQFLQMNISQIERSKKTEDESFWLSKAQSTKQNIASIDRAMLNDKSYWFWKAQFPLKRDGTNIARFALQLELSKAQNRIEQLMSERDNAIKEVQELRKLTDQQGPSSQFIGYFAEFSYSELQDATNNFDESFKLGEGGFGIVYKGILHKTTVAIKILKDGSSQGINEFNQEVETLGKVRHPNLVTLIGACAEVRALIYEYFPNGSLEDRLKCKNNMSPLSWQDRVRISFEICCALSFLHCSKPHGIVHGDLKPDNILLDLNNVSKISDFGLCRQLNWTDSASIPYHLTDCLKGTLAYMDPEYLSTAKITAQYDVYSFGIMLLRLATCKDPRGIRNLVEEAQKKGTLNTLVDPSAGSWPLKEAKKMMSLGLRCSDPIRKSRPNLSTKVWKELKSMMEVASASLFS